MNKFPIILLALLLTLSPVSACSSVVGSDSFGFQRDSQVAANITIENINGTIVESKPGFVHSVVFNDGDAFGIGGADSNICNKFIVSIGCLAHETGIPSLAFLAAPFTWYTGGHFVYNDNGTAYYMTFVGGINVGISTVEDGQYLIVSNDAICTGTYRASDVFTALNQSNFAVGHHRYAIKYQNGNYDIHNFQGENIV